MKHLGNIHNQEFQKKDNVSITMTQQHPPFQDAETQTSKTACPQSFNSKVFNFYCRVRINLHRIFSLKVSLFLSLSLLISKCTHSLFPRPLSFNLRKSQKFTSEDSLTRGDKKIMKNLSSGLILSIYLSTVQLHKLLRVTSVFFQYLISIQLKIPNKQLNKLMPVVDLNHFSFNL